MFVENEESQPRISLQGLKTWWKYIKIKETFLLVILKHISFQRIGLEMFCYSDSFFSLLIYPAFFLLRWNCIHVCLGKLDSGKFHLGESDCLRSWLWMQKVLKFYTVHQLSFLINLIDHGHFLQEFLDSISNTCTETLIFYKKAEPFQDGPQATGPTKLTSLKHAIENFMSILSSCKVYF